MKQQPQNIRLRPMKQPDGRIVLYVIVSVMIIVVLGFCISTVFYSAKIRNKLSINSQCVIVQAKPKVSVHYYYYK